MKTQYFIVLSAQNGRPVPMLTDADTLALFDSEEDASRVAASTVFGQHFGFKVYPWGPTRG